MRHSFRQTLGFSTVELLVTLFIGAILLAAGYQLFNVVMKDGGDTRAEATVSNVSYDYLRRYIESATNPCTTLTPLAAQAITIPTIANPVVTVAITCPQSDAPTLSRVEASITYGIGTDQKTIKSATYVDKSTGATTSAEVTDGLIGWWKLNQNGDSSVGNITGTVTNISPTTGQNGVGANAFLFNGSSSSILVPLTSMQKPTAAFSITGWFKTSSAASQVIAATTENGGWSFYTGISGCTTGVQFIVWVNGAYSSSCNTSVAPSSNVWIFAAGVYDGSSVKVYINNGAATSSAASGAMSWSTTTVPLCIGSEPSPTACTSSFFNGTLDDIRFYGRALSASEVLQLYNGGAK